MQCFVFRLSAVDFNTPNTLNALGVATGDIGQMCLSEISRTVFALQRQCKSSITQSITERPLYRYLRIVVISTFHLLADVFARFVVVRNQRVDFLRISERHLSAEVGVTGNEVCQRITAVVARKHSIDNSLSQRLDVSNQARTTFVQHQNDGLPGLGKSLHQIELVLGEEEVRQVTRSLAVRWK